MPATKKVKQQDNEQEVAERLAQINAALEALAKAKEPAEDKKKITIVGSGFVCPSDPAERALCEACQ